MVEKISCQELYRIVNRAVSLCTNHQDIALDTEIKLFTKRYQYHQAQNYQLSMFEEEIPTPQELRKAESICGLLEEYRQATDVYAVKEKELTERQCRDLLQALSDYRPHIYPENKAMADMLEKNLKRRLPEYKEKFYIEEYRREAARIHDMKRTYDRQRRKNQPVNKDYEKYALHFFKTLQSDNVLKETASCPEKLEMYAACLQIVDCLPSHKYNRTAKFKLKYNINCAIKNTAESLRQTAPDFAHARRYIEIAQKAEYDKNRYQQAVERSLKFAESRPMSIEARNKRAKDEWLYR